MNAYPEDTALIQDLVAYAGTNPAAVAKQAGVAVSTVNRPFNGTARNRLGRSVLEKLRRGFPDFPGWAGQMDPTALADRKMPYKTPATEARRSVDDTVEIAQIDLRFGLGAAIMDEEIGEQQVEKLSFPRAWLRMITASPPSRLYWARGQGNSMEPAISDGDVILIDRSHVTLGFGDLYWAFAYGQTGMIKRLRQMPDGSVKILSDNPSVPPEIAYDGELHLFGRVVAVVRRL